MNVDLDDGTDLRTVMERALQDVQAPADLGRHALAGGRRLQVRRRIGLAAGGAAAAAAVALIVVPGFGEGSGRAVDDTGVATSPTTDGPAPTDGPTEADSDDPWPDLESPEGWWDMPADDMLAALERHLPDGVRIAEPDAPGELDNGPGTLSAVLTGPTGSGLVSILLQPPPLDEVPPPVVSTDANGNEHTTVWAEGAPYGARLGCRRAYLACEVIRDEAGSRIGDVSTELDNGTTYHNADLVLPDGGAINVYVADSTGEKPGYEPPTADAPLLTLEQVRALVEDPIWTSYQP
jgi:hypothetical protein